MHQNNLELGSFAKELTNLREGVFMTTRTFGKVLRESVKLLDSELREYIRGVLETERSFREYEEKLELTPRENVEKSEPPGTVLTRMRL